MSLEVSQEEWALLYFRKKSQFNEFSQFKSKSFHYQKLLGKMHFLITQDQQNNRKQIREYIKSLNDVLEQMKNAISQMLEEMRFLKLQNIAALIESFEQLVTSMHYYNIKDKKIRMQQKRDQTQNQKPQTHQNCQKCTVNINKMNVKKVFDQITTTEVANQDQSNQMTKEQRRKMISQLDQYDILIAEKDNYLRKVNAVLENKGKVKELSNVDKTYNFLSQYLNTIEKLQQKRAKNQKQNLTPIQIQESELKWQQESYKQILQYIKRVILEHFVNECSGPVKEMFQKINIDKFFKEYGENVQDAQASIRHASMKNHQTQTLMTSEAEQLKMIERRMEFKVKEIATLKTNKDELEKKYIVCLESNRKIQSEVYDLKRQRKHLECEIKTANQNITILNQKYKEKIEQFEEEQKRTFQDHIFERQKIVKASKRLEAELKHLQTEHKKCESGKKKKETPVSVETQTTQSSLENQNLEDLVLSQTEPQQFKKRKSLFKNTLLASFKAERRSLSKEVSKEIIPEIMPEETDKVNEHSEEESLESLRAKLTFFSKVYNLQVCLTDEERSGLLKSQKSESKQEDKNKNKNYKLNKYVRNKYTKTEQSQTTLTGQENSSFPNIDKSKRIKVSMQSFRRDSEQKKRTPAEYLSASLNKYRFSKFNRHTEIDPKFISENQKLNLLEEEVESDHSEMNGNSVKEQRGYQVSERLYKRKEKENEDVPFERVIEQGKEKFYIKKISRESINYKTEKDKIKEISQILKPYVYNNNTNNNNLVAKKRKESRTNLKTIRQRLSQLSHSSQKRFSVERKPTEEGEMENNSSTLFNKNDSLVKENRDNSNRKSRDSERSGKSKKAIGKAILSVQHIIESEYAYLKAVGFIDFILKIGHENKKVVKAMNKIHSEVKQMFKNPTEKDLELFGGTQEAEHYIRGKNFWNGQNIKQNMMIYTKNDNLSMKVQKYFNLLRRANPELFGTLIAFLTNPIFAVFGKEIKSNFDVSAASEDNYFVKELFNQLQKYHKIKHSECTHISDFLQRIGFYKYTYF